MLSAFKNFGITFLISAVLFGVIAYFATGFVTNEVTDLIDKEKNNLDEIISNLDTSESESESESVQNNPATGEELKIPEGESFNFVVLSTDYRPDLYSTYAPSAALMGESNWDSVPAEDTLGALSSDYREVHVTSIVLVRIDKEDRQFTYTYITPLTRVYTTSGYRTLSEVYSLYGKAAVADYVHSLTGIKVKYTFLVNAYNLDKLTSMINGVTVTAPKNIYYDGMYNTFNMERTEERTEADGTKYTEHIPNDFVISAGDKYLDFTNAYHLTAVLEHSASDISVKEVYMTQMLREYLEYFASLGEEKLKLTLAKLITRESEWGNLDASGTVQSNTSDDTVAADGGTLASEANSWIPKKFEPDTPVVETDDYTMNDFDSIAELICAVEYFENITVSYPGTYHPADTANDEFFVADMQAALETFKVYREDITVHESSVTQPADASAE